MSFPWPIMWSMDGYMCSVDWDGQTLTITGTNKAGKFALLGPDWKQGSVSLQRAEIAGVHFRDASPMVNGEFTVFTGSGKKYIAHFRRKDREPFRGLAAEFQDLIDARKADKAEAKAASSVPPVDDGLVYQFTSHTAGLNAQVWIYRDRVEWTKPGFFGAQNKAGHDMVPIQSVVRVSVRRDGLANSIVSLHTSGGDLDFRVSHAEAAKVRQMLTEVLNERATPVLTDPADPVDQIRKLAELHSAGVLSDDEFEAKKTELLGRL